MTFLRITALAVLCALLSGGADSDGAMDSPPDTGLPHVPGELVVTYDRAIAGARAAIASQGARVVQDSPRLAVVRVPEGEEALYAARLSGLPGVQTAELNLLSQPAHVPNDELYPLQWNLPMIEMEQAWDLSLGEGVVVAVLDTGVAFEDNPPYGQAPDLADTQFVAPRNVFSRDAGANDDHGHGTHVAGTISQDTDNGIGTAGVAPAAAIMPVKVCLFYGCPSSAIAEGIYWAVDNGADIINLSLGGPSVSRAERDAYEYAFENGVVVVAASGNGSGGSGKPFVDYPAAVESVISVGAIRLDGTRAKYSNYGPGEGGAGLDLVAPGGDLSIDQNQDGYGDGIIQNTYAFACSAGPYDLALFHYCFYHGTSMAAPHVSGVAALILSLYPDLGPQEVRDLLHCSAKDLGEPGYDLEYGHGLVQAYEAIRDVNDNGIPDCLETPVPAGGPMVSIGSATAFPGETATVLLGAQLGQLALSAYTIEVSYNGSIVNAVACTSVPPTICNVDTGDDLVLVTGVSVDGQTGTFSFAEIEFVATGKPDAVSLLGVAAPVLTDAGLNDVRGQVALKGGHIIIGDPLTVAVAGDANCDGIVDSIDALMVLRHTADLGDAPCLPAADVDCSGDITPIDALHILAWVAGDPAVALPGCPPIGE